MSRIPFPQRIQIHLQRNQSLYHRLHLQALRIEPKDNLTWGIIASTSVDGIIEVIETDRTNDGKRIVAKDLNYSTMLLFFTYEDKGGDLVTYHIN